MINFNVIKNIFSAFIKTKVLNAQPATEQGLEKLEDKNSDMTFRLDELEKESKSITDYIICNGEKVAVDARVVQLPLPSNCFTKSKKARAPTSVVVHWDAALSSQSCYNILKARKISTHFSIDNDGTIYQFVDSNDVCWHSGPTSQDRLSLSKKNVQIPKGVSWNNISIGIDISNAYYPKYNDAYVKKGLSPRPLIKSKCHGMNLEHLGYYPAQIESFKHLVQALCDFYNINLDYPKGENNELLRTFHLDCVNGKFNGILNHYNLTNNKIDTSGFPIDEVIEELRKEGNR